MSIELVFAGLLIAGFVGIRFPGFFQWLCDLI